MQFALLLLLSACDSGPRYASCAEDPRAVEIEMYERVPGATLDVAITGGELPACPCGNNWNLTVEQDGAGVSDCTLTGTTYKPDEDRFGPEPIFADETASGNYDAFVQFEDTGYWELRIEADCPEVADTFVLGFCFD